MKSSTRPHGGADEVVVVAHQVLGQLVAPAFVAGDDAVDDADLLEHDEVAVGRALGERRAAGEQLGDGRRAGGVGEQVDDRPAAVRVALVGCPQPLGDGVVQLLPACLRSSSAG